MAISRESRYAIVVAELVASPYLWLRWVSLVPDEISMNMHKVNMAF